MSAEPCSVCDEDTSLGHASYFGRREAIAPDGRPRFFCAECHARNRPERRNELSDEERRRLDDHAAMFGLAFNATGH